MPSQKKNNMSLLQDMISQIYGAGEGAVNIAKDFLFKPPIQAAEPVAQPRREIPLPSTTQYPDVPPEQVQERPYKRNLIDEIVTGGDKKKRAYDVRQLQMDEALKRY